MNFADQKGLVIFDVDELLINAEQEMRQATLETIQSLGAPIDLEFHTAFCQGRAASDVLVSVSEHFGVKIAPDDFSANYLERAERAILRRSPQIMRGALESITGLKHAGHFIAACSNNPRRLTLASLHATALLPQFDGVHGVINPDDQTPCKPNPRMLEKLMEHFGVSPDRTVMVGDMPTDMEAATNAGVAGIGVLHSVAHDADLLERKRQALLGAGAELVLEDLTSLLNVLGVTLRNSHSTQSRVSLDAPKF